MFFSIFENQFFLVLIGNGLEAFHAFAIFFFIFLMLTMKTNSNHFQLFFPPRASKKIKTVIFNFEFFDFFARNVETAQEKDTTKNEFLRKIKKVSYKG